MTSRRSKWAITDKVNERKATEIPKISIMINYKGLELSRSNITVQIAKITTVHNR